MKEHPNRIKIKLKLKGRQNNWREEWKGMPEYDNTHMDIEKITVKFRFRCQEDFDEFHALIKKHLYGGNKVFDGMQRKEKKSAWYPPRKKDSLYVYE